MKLFRDLGRRKLRSTLTITGIAIGIMALVVFGSMANKMNALIDGGSQYYADKAVVSVGNMYTGSFQPLSLSADLEQIRNVAKLLTPARLVARRALRREVYGGVCSRHGD